MRTLSLSTQRKMERFVHLLAGAVLLVSVYVPMGAELHGVIRFVVFPVLVMSGMAMWQAPRVLRTLRRRRAATQPPARVPLPSR